MNDAPKHDDGVLTMEEVDPKGVLRTFLCLDPECLDHPDHLAATVSALAAAQQEVERRFTRAEILRGINDALYDLDWTYDGKKVMELQETVFKTIAVQRAALASSPPGEKKP